MQHKFNIYINTKLSAVSLRMQFSFSSLTKYLRIQLSFLLYRATPITQSILLSIQNCLQKA